VKTKVSGAIVFGTELATAKTTAFGTKLALAILSFLARELRQT
jgi:hypothetical protein